MPFSRRLQFAFCILSITGCTAAVLPPANRSVDEAELQFFPENLAEPIQVLYQTADHVIATITAERPQLTDVTLDGRPFTQVRIPGFAMQKEAGMPTLPFVKVLVNVPQGSELEFSIIEQTSPEDIELEHELAFQFQLPVHSGVATFAAQNMPAYQHVHGEHLVEITEQSYAGSQKIAEIKFYPLRYDPMSQRLSWTSFAKVDFKFRPVGLRLAATDEPPVMGQWSEALNQMTINASATRPRAYPDTKTDLLIIHESFRGGAINRYIEFKRQRGRQVRDIYVSNKTASQVKEMIVQAYRSQPNPSHTLLIGSLKQIPAFSGQDDNTWTDFPYTTIDQGRLPDISLGRIPAHNDTELNAFIDKAMARETQQRNTDQVLLTSGKDASLGCPTNVKRVGKNFATSGNNVKISEQLLAEGKSRSDIIRGYNESPNLVVYDGHGYQEGMSEVPLLIRNLSELTNTSYPIILDIACLNANWSRGADARNFAESILLAPGRGAAGILASGGSGDGHEFFQNLGSIMAQGRQKVGTQANEIGYVVMAAKIKGGTEDRNYWNYYGDPASSVWESQPAGNNTSPAAPPTPAIAAALWGTGDTPHLLASLPDTSGQMSYCVGDMTACARSDAVWVPMNRVETRQGFEIFQTVNPLNITAPLQIVLSGKGTSGAMQSRLVAIKN